MSGHPVAGQVRAIATIAVAALCALALTLPVSATSGPSLIENINPSGDSNPTGLTRVGSTVFFAANDGVHGTELWKSDGTAAGTKMVKNIRPYAKGSFPGDLVNVNGTLFFTANDGTHGRELWQSNGTAAGTKMVEDLTNDEFSGTNTRVYLPVAIGSRLYFFVSDCCAGGSSLLISDGTAAGTHRIGGGVEDVSSARGLGSKLYFVQLSYAGDPPQRELWVSNGTAASTHRLSGSPSADEMFILPASGRYLYFATSRMVSGVPRIKLWRTDGSATGTIALTTAGQLATMPEEAVYLNHAIYFISGGLWKTDGSAAGTKLIKDGYFLSLVTAGGRLYFVSDDGHLWRSDGTATGTKDIGSPGDGPNGLVAVGSYVCFTEFNTFDGWWRLWVTTGTSAGTHAVRSWPTSLDVRIGPAVGARLYFAANDGTHGNELWRYTP